MVVICYQIIHQTHIVKMNYFYLMSLPFDELIMSLLRFIESYRMKYLFFLDHIWKQESFLVYPNTIFLQ